MLVLVLLPRSLNGASHLLCCHIIWKKCCMLSCCRDARMFMHSSDLVQAEHSWLATLFDSRTITEQVCSFPVSFYTSRMSRRLFELQPEERK